MLPLSLVSDYTISSLAADTRHKIDLAKKDIIFLNMQYKILSAVFRVIHVKCLFR